MRSCRKVSDIDKGSWMHLLAALSFAISAAWAVHVFRTLRRVASQQRATLAGVRG